jgi:uncharacterized protein
MNKFPEFKPAWWLNNPHLQTMWTEVMRKRVTIPLTHQQFELSCGDFIDLSWSQTGKNQTVLLLHGLGGSVESPYIQGMIQVLNQHNFNTLVMHFRGCSKEPNRLPQMFHGGQTCDLAEVISHLKSNAPDHPIFAIGFSIGGNILLKYLGEYGDNSQLSGAVAISVPFLLDKTQENLSKGFSKVYQHYLLVKLKMAVIKKIMHTKHDELDLWSVFIAKDIKHFDELITAPLHGFQNANDYYLRSSSHSYLRNIKTPTLVIHAKDDPFLPQDAIPKREYLSESVQLLLTENGGHVGFVSGNSPNTPTYWLEQAAPLYLANLIDNL